MKHFELFTSDKAAFLIDGSWKVGGIEEAVDDIDNYTVTYVPRKRIVSQQTLSVVFQVVTILQRNAGMILKMQQL